jgi:hypothetical protein
MKRGSARLPILGVVALVLVGSILAAGVRLGRAQARRIALGAVGPDTVLLVPWGALGATVGRLDASEGASEGPMSFAIASGGDVVVLDQVNLRVAWFDASGTLVRDVAIPARSFQELELAADGRMVLLDRLVRRSLLVLAARGGVEREVSVPGPGIVEGGAVTAMLAEPDGIWLEVGHRERVRLLDERLAPVARTVRRGRPYADDKDLMAALDGRGGASLWLEAQGSGQTLVRATVPTAHRIDRIVWLEADARGDVQAFFHLLDLDPAHGTGVIFEQVLAVRFDASLRPRARFQSPWVIQQLEQYREIRVQPDGTVYQMAFEPNGMRIVRWRWQ